MLTQISIELFASLVKEMRSAQNEYLRYKTKKQIIKVKVLEYRVDKITKSIPAPLPGEYLKQEAESLKLFK